MERLDDFSQPALEGQGEPDAIFRDAVASLADFKDIFNKVDARAASTVAQDFGNLVLIDDGDPGDPQDGGARDLPQFVSGVVDDAPAFVPGVIDAAPTALTFDPGVVESLEIPSLSLPDSLQDLGNDVLDKLPKLKPSGKGSGKPSGSLEKPSSKDSEKPQDRERPAREVERELPAPRPEREPREIPRDNPGRPNVVRDGAGRVTEIDNQLGKTQIMRDSSGEVTGLNTPDGDKFVKVGGKWFELRSDPAMTSPRTMEVHVGDDGTIVRQGQIGKGFAFQETMRPDGSRIQDTRTENGATTSFEFAKDGKIQRILQVSPDGRKVSEQTFN